MSGPALRHGLPGHLPPGERLLWQGAPDWRTLARRGFHLRSLAIYFGVIITWSALAGLHGGAALIDVARSALLFVAVALVPLVGIALYAWLTARATTYTLTDRRMVMRFGVALPMSINLPFARIDGAGFRPAPDGTGDITLALVAGDKIAYPLLWPHARPWRLSRPEPMLRAVPDAARVAQLLSRALAASADAPAPVLSQLPASGVGANIPPIAASA